MQTLLTTIVELNKFTKYWWVFHVFCAIPDLVTSYTIMVQIVFL